MELRQQELPDEAEWEAARRRAKEVFGLGDFDAALLTAANVAALAGKVQELAERHRASRRTTWPARSGCRWPGWVPRTRRSPVAPRWRTAQAADALVTGLVGKDATAALKHLAQAKLDTSAAAIKTSLGKAAGVLAALDKPSQWETFDPVAQIHGERPASGRRLADGTEGGPDRRTSTQWPWSRTSTPR